MALLVVALAFAIVGPRPAWAGVAARDTKAAKHDDPPTVWDERIAPIAHEVERIRGLTFEHPVAVEYLDDATFRKRVTDDGDDSERERAEEKRSEAQLHAVGLIAADVDLAAATDDFTAAGVLAYYDPDTQKITVRGTQLDAMAKQTIAHELTHALDDQHFDLDRLERTARKARATSPLTALIEGDAVRVADEYVRSLPDAERADGSSRRRDAGTSVDGEVSAAGVPAAVQAFFGSPYQLGLQMVKVVAEEGGNGAVDRLFRTPPTSELAFVDIGTAGSAEQPLKVPPPPVEAGERRVGPRDSFGTYALYLVLSTAMDPVEALDVVRGWGGDAMVTVARDDATCVRANFTGKDPDASAALGRALARWSTNGAHPSSKVSTVGPITSLVTCATDAPTTDPVRPITSAQVTVALRNDLLLEARQAGIERASATCTVDGVIHSSAFATLRDHQLASPGVTPSSDVLQPLQRAVQRSVAECRSST